MLARRNIVYGTDENLARPCPTCGAAPGRYCGAFAGGHPEGRYRIREDRWFVHDTRDVEVTEPGIARTVETRTGTGENLDLFALAGA